MNPYPHLPQPSGSYFTFLTSVDPSPQDRCWSGVTAGCSPTIQLSAPSPLGKDTCLQSWLDSILPA